MVFPLLVGFCTELVNFITLSETSLLSLETEIVTCFSKVLNSE